MTDAVSRSEVRELMFDGAPVTVRTVDIGGTATSVVEGGAGAPMVLLHGAIECGGALWLPVAPLLVPDYRLIIPDLPGLGESARLRRIDLDSFSAWFGELLAHLDVERPTVIAHSLVGTLATRFAARHSSLLSRLIVYASPGIGHYRMPVELRYRILRFALRPTPSNLAAFQRFALLDRDSTRDRDPAWFDAFSAYTLACARDRDAQATMRQLLFSQTKEIAAAETTRIGVPTALLWGRADRMVPLRVAESAAALRGWPVFIVDGAGHVPHMEQPRRFVETLGTICGGSES